MIRSYTSSSMRGDFKPDLAFTWRYISFTVSEKDFLVFLCKLETAILAASCTVEEVTSAWPEGKLNQQKPVLELRITVK